MLSVLSAIPGRSKLKTPLPYGLAINLILLMLVLATALALVRWQYRSRSLFAAVEELQKQGRQLASDNVSALAKKGTLTTATHIQQVAERNLSMKMIDPPVTIYLSAP